MLLYLKLVTMISDSADEISTDISDLLFAILTNFDKSRMTTNVTSNSAMSNLNKAQYLLKMSAQTEKAMR
jgi:hypothetical protein